MELVYIRKFAVEGDTEQVRRSGKERVLDLLSWKEGHHRAGVKPEAEEICPHEPLFPGNDSGVSPSRNPTLLEDQPGHRQHRTVSREKVSMRLHLQTRLQGNLPLIAFEALTNNEVRICQTDSVFFYFEMQCSSHSYVTRVRR